MNKHIKLFKKRVERLNNNPSKYNLEQYEKSVSRILTEFIYKQDLIEDLNQKNIKVIGNNLLKIGGDYGIDIKFSDIIVDLEFNVKKQLIFDYIDHLFAAEENKLKPLTYLEFIKLKG